MSDEPVAPPKLQVQIDDDVSQGVYSNLVLINHTENEFVLDFAFIQPSNGRAKVRARVISSPRHTKRLLMALQKNLERYEERYGRIELVATKNKRSISRRSTIDRMRPTIDRLTRTGERSTIDRLTRTGERSTIDGSCVHVDCGHRRSIMRARGLRRSTIDHACTRTGGRSTIDRSCVHAHR